MVASLFTIALNLNPLAKFDGYYLAVAITGINNLRSRAFSFYSHLLTAKPINETRRDCWILAAYAPFSLAYIWFVFGFLFLRITDWILLNIPTTAFLLLLVWAIYFYFPRKSSVATGFRERQPNGNR
jgi:putative peptide zinc metalloprotease protein